MALTVGSRLGHYTVDALIGEGGMGQVYQATDTKLNRQVALKILPEAFATDPDRLARFQREAQVLASLNHPNIAAIYGLEESGDTRALVLELVEGPTLADRIKQGAIPVDEALPIAKQIADALEEAHEHGVVHRDLKPANIKIRPDGTVKVLDFGLAKAFQSDASDPSMSQSPTISLTAAATQMGMVIGTPAYMAPEQAKGHPADKRADIWAFGAVLFEMLTGKKLFETGDVSEMLASVLVKDPDISSIGTHVPEHIRSVIRHCLVKDPKERLRDIGDVRLAMKGMFETTVSAATVDTSHQQRVWQRPVAAMALALVIAAVTGLAVWMLARVPQARDVTRSNIELPAGLRPIGVGNRVDLSRDGRTLVFSAADATGLSRLYVRQMDQFAVTALQDTEGGDRPFFSPDGAWIGFMDSPNNSLRKVSIDGGISGDFSDGILGAE
ncbi:MAG: serine/threonine-protein kinase [Chloroflexi bacterium]|nr:serine/threonine-protein kinase [Chloroflexota bacterium]